MSTAGEERSGVAEAPPEDTPDVEERPTDPAEAEREEHPGSFDPGPETGYLRKGPRAHELPVEIGAEPFDPGPEIGFDSRRAKRAARRQEKADRKQREREERERRELDAAAAAKRAEQEREQAELERTERAQEEQRQRAERARAERRQRTREERERQEAKRREDAERKRREQQERERREREKQEKARPEKTRAAAAEPRAPAGKQRVAAEKPKPAAQRRRAGRTKQTARAKQPPDPRKQAPRLAPPDAEASLRRPTAKAGVALVVVIAVAFGAGALLGLPLPLVGGDSEQPAAASLASEASLAGLDPGTPTGLTKGPYFPMVTANPDFGETAAKFHADRGGRKHGGQDVFARPGTPLVAVRDGIVVDGAGGPSFYSYGGGNDVVIYSPIDDRSYVYLHMLKPALVRAGEHVKAGQLVGQVGCTGSCDGPHLHFEIRLGRAVYGPQKKPIDPLPYLRQWPQRPTG